MLKLLKISFLTVKNAVVSKEFLIGLLAAFSYSMLWVFLVHPKAYGAIDYDFEFGRFLYVIILYAAVSVLRDDIRFNTTKTVFAGTFTRIEIMLSKVVSLILWGIVFSFVVEANTILVSLILYRKIGFTGFLALNHLQLWFTYIVITFSMGSLMLLIISVMFSEKKAILFFIVILSMVNFYTAGITTFIGNHPDAVHTFSSYMKTPFFNTTLLMQGQFNMQSVFIDIAWAAVFFTVSVFVINMREIK